MGPHLQVADAAAPEPTLADVYREHVDFVVRTARYLGVTDGQAEDVVHEVFLVVHRRLSDFDGNGSMRSWLYGITRRVAMHHRRGSSRARAREVHAPRPVPDPGPDEAVARRQLADIATTCIDELEAEQRMVLLLVDVEGLSAPEVATAHGLNVNTVYSRLRLARQKFERALTRRLTIGEGVA